MTEYKKGDYEFRLYTYDCNELTDGLAFMVNDSNKWEVFNIFEPVDNTIKVLFRFQYQKTQRV